MRTAAALGNRGTVRDLALILASGAVLFSVSIGRDAPRLSHEGRHAEIAREMNETRSWAAPRLVSLPYHEKPPLYYWLAGLSFRLTGSADTASARLVSVILSLFSLAAVYFFGRALLDRTGGLVAAFILASTIPWVRDSGASRTDMTAAAFNTLAAALYWLALGPGAGAWARWGGGMMGGLSMALAVLGKGPVGPAILLVGFMVYFLTGRREQCPRPAAILAALLGFLAPLSLWAIAVRWAGEEAYLRDLLLGDGIPKAWDKYPEPPYYYLGVFPARFLPFSLLLPFSVLECIQTWRDPDPAVRRGARLPLILMVSGLLVLSCIRSKRDQYLLSIYPFAALHLAFFATRWIGGSSRFGWRGAGEAVRARWAAFLLALWFGGLTIARSGGFWVNDRGEQVLLDHIRTQVPADARAVAYATDAEPFAFAWPTVPLHAGTPEDLRTALDQGVEYVMIAPDYFKKLPTDLRARLSLAASQGESPRYHIIQLWRARN